MQREIGSNFWIDPKIEYQTEFDLSPELFHCQGSDFVWLSTGRSALAFVLETINKRNPARKKTALIPAFTCHTVIEPFWAAGYEVKTLPLSKNLITAGEALLKAAEETGASVVLLHRYFGFDTLADCVSAVEMLRSLGTVVIEDRTQCLYSSFAPLPVDYIIGSIRKWAEMPDGSFAVCRDGVFEEKPKDSDQKLLDAKIAAGTAKYKYLFEGIGEKADFLAQYREAEELLDRQEGYFSIGPVSLRIQAALDADQMRERRRENYQTLLQGINGSAKIRPVFPVLPEGITPLYCPVWVEGNRKELQSQLANASIYAPIVWPKAENLPPVCPEAEALYKQLLCLPIDQRYGKEDMERIAWQVNLAAEAQGMPPDIYYLPEWRELYARRDGENCGCYVLNHPYGTVLYPYVLRKTPPAGDGETYYDIITPYGFNGPCVVDRNSGDLSALAAAFEQDFSRYCREHHIIAEYVRFSPWLKNVDVFGPFYTLRDNGQTVAIDLTVDDIFRDEISSKRRNLIRAAQKKGVVVEFDETGETVEEFYRLYQNTIQKNEISSYYQFPLSFLQEHFRALGSHVCIANAKVDGKIISSSFLLQCGDHMHYHLSANDYTMTAYQGNSLLLYEAAKRGKAFGCKYLHLGGVGTAEPTLMHFKLSFTHHGGMPFFVGSRVRNQQIFGELSAKYGTGRPGYFPPYRG